MIDKRPSPGDLTDWVMEPYEPADAAPNPVLHDEYPFRHSAVLGADGEPLMVAVPRRAIGFDLTRRKEQ